MENGHNCSVVHFKDGKVLKGHIFDFIPTREIFHLTPEPIDENSEHIVIKTGALKAIFLVKTLEGNKDYVEKTRFDDIDTSLLHGIKIKAEFTDGEIIRGVSLTYNKDKKGFYLNPIDPKSNNNRIYIFMDALRSITTGSDAEN